ncbi:hypothetical protein BDC45DRAFT_542377 [Circinella umbellata]|nr:hypothetical protein BDC45DRAFT_542377 [Circinella umbellata]
MLNKAIVYGACVYINRSQFEHLEHWGVSNIQIFANIENQQIFNIYNFVQHRAKPKEIFIDVQYQGNRMIDLDPDICDYAVVLKNEDSTIARQANNPNEEAKLIYDWWLLLHSRDGYFACFKRIVQELGLNL